MEKHLQILIIDDSTSTRRGLRELLDPLQAEVVEAKDGRQGLALSQDGRFDLILTDIDMPEMDGIEFCQYITNNPKTRGTPVIMVSAFDSNSDIDIGFHAGAWAYVSKREARSELLETIKEVLLKSTFHRERMIMVVDDSLLVCRMVREGLERAGFQVITARNGKIALDLVQRQPPDLILSDLDMPVMNGFEFCQAIHADSRYAVIPFVVMSTISDRGHMKRIIQEGAASYIVKPFNIDQLVILVERLLSDQFLLLLKDRERLETERTLMLGSIASLISALEARDPYTRGHSETVARIVSGIATLMGLSKQQTEAITIGGRLHDIGKIGVRDDILFKPGPLTPREFEIIKQHPVIGANILKPISSLKEIVSIVLYHHERPDGKGYPYGLSAPQIPLWASMISVADTYAALRSKRPYQSPIPREQAIQIIQEVRGTQLCPECVDLFLKWIELNQDIEEEAEYL
ncbi:response regulator receiver modulated metal dependent phosphohydrolase [Candidatus Vecturithrix granuli]|uniref:Response regulator receiver modulated metal dependent phosphohydrolase n=1 Tax=Vecturithrix granuli TaxID=1499967 RepID=A0A0S6WB33_VECG1|nr:response regulator receiver modulated metal dependent phosphohydrolase [Candidatus Vecturithrix granuli]